MFNKRIFLLGTVIALFASVVTGCDAEKEQDDTITIWAYDNYALAAEKAVEIYEKKYPTCDYNFEVVSFGQEDLVEKIKMALSTGDVGTLPDLFYDEDYNFSEYVELYEECFVDLSNDLKSDDFYPYKTVNTTFNNKLYAIPYDVCTAVMFYRTDMIRAAGYTDEDMKNITWDKYIEIGQKVKSATGKDMIIMCPEGDMEGRIMYQSAGVWFYDNAGESNMNDPAFRDAFLTMKSVYDSDIVYHSNGWDDYIAAISDEKMVSLIGGSFWADIIAQYTEQTGLWRITNIPRMVGNDTYTNYSNLSGGNWFVVNNNNSEFASNFAVEMFANNQELANYVAENYLICPANKYLSANLVTGTNSFYDNQNVPKLLSEFNQYIPTVRYGFNTYEMTYTVGPIVNEYIFDKISLDDAIKKMDDAAKQATSNVTK